MYKYFLEKEIIGLDPKLVSMLDIAREVANTPFHITSGFRTTEQNEKIGGVIDSAHLKGLAVDLRCDNSSNRFRIVQALLDAGFRRIEITEAHIHTDIDETKKQNVIFFKPK